MPTTPDAPIWIVIRNPTARKVYGPFRIKVHEWENEEPEDLFPGYDGIARHYYSEAEAVAAVDSLKKKYRIEQEKAVPPHLRSPDNATTWWVIRDQASREVRGPFKVEPHEWEEDDLRVQDMTGSHGTADHYYSEAEAVEAATRLEEQYERWNREDDALERQSEERIARQREEHADYLDRIGLGPL